VPSELATRFGHTEPKLGKATVSREAKTASRTVPAGTFEVDVYAVAVDGGDTTTWYVEHAGPHRIVGWESSAGEKAAMRGSARLPYWELNKPGGEAERAKMGL
jgi:plastocyanin